MLKLLVNNRQIYTNSSSNMMDLMIDNSNFKSGQILIHILYAYTEIE